MRNVCLAIFSLVCTACMAQEPHVVLNGERYTVEIADTVELQALGLMFREEMADEIEVTIGDLLTERQLALQQVGDRDYAMQTRCPSHLTSQ